MRNFIISAICVFLVGGVWFSFHLYSSQKTEYFSSEINMLISEYIPEANWEMAADVIDELGEQWDSYKRYASFFLDSKPITDIDCTLQKTRYYIYAKDTSNSTGELANLMELFQKLHGNERLTPENLF